ncbi:YqbF domain-containing protein [Bacillus sp. FSL W7-1334]|jgi:hypothetical protein|uniref:YqbF domain-containing protein n=1 Tax=Bacillus sp. FSL W7-1334 TaxID=2921703 RepID=UPI0030FC8AF9|nr:hypothetical protein [Bacillus cereus]
MYYVKLIKNKSFYFFNHRFIHEKEEQVDEKIFNYLRENNNFEVRKGDIEATES